jgi:uncharacterized RDD family membrane protein YckC
MEPLLNPYAPGAGRRPPELAGRSDELRRFEVLLARMEHGRSDRGVMLTGLRGVGKTVLINELRAEAERRGWIVGKVEAGGGRPLRVLAAQSLHHGLRSVQGQHGAQGRLRRALAVFKAFSLTVAPDGGLALGIDIDPASGRADTGDLELDLAELIVDLGETSMDLGIGTLLLVDEMQDLERMELAALAGACHEAGQRDLPVAVVGAGLPNLPTSLTAAKSYAERLFEYRGIGPLDSEDAAAALTRPADGLGARWEQGALDVVLAASAGYPYFLQVYGRSTWDLASSNPIRPLDAELGVAAAQRELDFGFYGSRWDRATPSQRTYLRALAEGGEAPQTTGEVARRLGRRPSDVSVARDQLIRKGLLFAPDRGSIAFTVPGMASFVFRQPDP